ncbi:MAG: winged helix-turn-helix domain-containing protein [Caldilineaceae bacterium]|nr:winged helix-turn-helix domain-containing protein [Caldilineaceae bacterium]HRJ41018.1 BTAD domain-containing putative transcriptional regulator [Caldilineaceae bacterium]
MDTLTISLFGGLQVLPPGAGKPLRLAPSAQALLAFLLVQQHPVPRDVLMDVFWMETPPERARSNLASAVYRLRQQLEAEPVTPGTYLLSRRSGEVGFNWESAHWLDSQTFTASVRPLLRKPIPDLSAADVCTLEDALTLYRGDLLEGIYDDWALREREHYRSLYLHCLSRLLRYYAGRGEYGQSILYAQEILRKDPLHEESHRELMRLYEAVGQPEQALRHYEYLCGLLRREMDQPPLAETAAVAREISARAHLRLVGPASGPTPELARLLQELEIAKRNLAEASRLLESISQAAAILAGTVTNR